MGGAPLEDIKAKYHYHIKPGKIVTAIQFLQSQLPVIPGKVSDKKIDGHLFKNLPVYSLGGKSLNKLFAEYSLTYDQAPTNIIGLKNFVSLGQILCKRGEIKTGLSSYYVQLRHADLIMVRMLKRLGQVKNVVGIALEGSNVLQDNTNYLQSEWSHLYNFTQYHFSNHVEQDSKWRSHCCRYALNKTLCCNHHHPPVDCRSCSKSFSFFKIFEKLITHVIKQLRDDCNYTEEIRSMAKASQEIIAPVVLLYMAHRVRAKAQFFALKR